MTLRFLLFGIDGASYEVVSALMEAGRLPHLAALAERGASGALRATFPPHTAPGWASMFTGVEPGRHGIYQFWDTQSANYGARVTSSNDFGWEPVWRTLERHGLRVGVLNVPMTHPPSPLRGGYMVSWPLSRTLHYAQPPSLIGELARAGCHYHSDLVTMYRGQEDYLERAREYVGGRTRSVIHLLEHRPVDALFVVYTEVDRVSHHYWGGADAPSSDVVETYEAVDRALGAVLEHVSDETLVAVASDHGFGRCRYNLNLHLLLERNGLAAIALRPDGGGNGAPADDTGADESASWFESVRRYRRVIDWERTRAYLPTPGCFGINLNRAGRQQRGIVEAGAESRKLADELASLVAGIRDPESGEVLFDLLPREEVYRGPRVAEAPDLVLMPRVWDVMPHPSLDCELFAPPTQQAIHRMEGLLVAAGPGIPRTSLSGARIEDVTPLLLAQLGLPVPEGVDGRWLFEPAGGVRREPPRTLAPTKENALSSEDQKRLEQRLTALGYA